MNIKHVKLNGGPLDGVTSIASHQTAIVNGEVYVWSGGAEDQFVHAKTELRKLSDAQFQSEKEMIKAAMPDPFVAIASIPAWRINCWLQLLMLADI